MRLLLDKYRLNLLSTPRENTSIGDVYITDRDGQQHASPPGNIKHLLDPPFDFSRIRLVTEEAMADVSGTISNNTSLDFGFKFLEGFLNILVAGVFGTDIKAALQSENVQKLKFQFSETTREYVEPNDFGYKLDGYTVNDKGGLFDPKSKYFLVTSVFRSPSIGIDAERTNERVIDVATKILQSADISSKVSYSKSEQGMIVFTGKIKLGYAIQLFELEYDSDTKRVRMKPIKEYYRVLEEGKEQERTRQVLKPAFIGNEEERDTPIIID